MLAIFRKSKLSNVLAGSLALLFLAWFILPSCACQLQALFGEYSGVKKSTSAGIVLEGDYQTTLNCHCDDDSAKTFYSFPEGDSLPFDVVTFLDYTDIDLILAYTTSEIPSNRGPPWTYKATVDVRKASHVDFCKFLI